MGELRLGRIVTRTKGRGTKRQGTGRFDWVKKTQEVIVTHGQNVTVDVLIGS